MSELYLGGGGGDAGDGGGVEVVHSIPTPLAMARGWVAANKPLLIKGAVKHWPAVDKWTVPYLR